MRRKFYYNEELYEDIASDDNLVICAKLGTGKSESVKKYLSETKGDRILLVANETSSQNGYEEDLQDKVVIHNKMGSNERVVGDFNEALNSLTDDKNTLCITKVKFNQLLTIKPTTLGMFHKIIVDEANGINPILVSDITSDIDKMIDNLSPFIKMRSNKYYKDFFKVIEFLKDIRDKNMDKDYLLFYQEDVNKELQMLAKDIIRNVRRLYEENKIYGITDITLLFGLLNAMSNNELYLGDMRINGGKKIFMLFANTFLNDYIQSSSTIIKILDGTADNIKPLYDWLGIRVRRDYKCNEKKYPNLHIHIHKYKNLTPAKGRNDKGLTNELAKSIIDDKKNDILTFVIKKFFDDEKGKFNKKFELLDYAFSGRDVGFNGYRDLDEMNIVYYQTLPRHYRMLWNRIFKDYDFQESCSHKRVDEAEVELVGAMLCQLVGRLKIRSDNNADVNIHCHCLTEGAIDSIVTHFGIFDENIHHYEKRDVGIELNNKKEKEILRDLQTYIRIDNPDKIILVDWIREFYYTKETSQKTINNMYRNLKTKIEDVLTDSHVLVSKRGRGAKAYIEKVN